MANLNSAAADRFTAVFRSLKSGETMANKIGDGERLVSTPGSLPRSRSPAATPEDDAMAIIQLLPSPLVQREIWKRQRKCRNCPRESTYALSCAEFDIDPTISTAAGGFSIIFNVSNQEDMENEKQKKKRENKGRDNR